MKVLIYDIETTPNISYTWGMYEQDVIDIVKRWELLSVAYKWLGDKDVTCITREGERSDKALTKKLWKLLNEADVVIAHNGVEFDNKKAAAKFLEHGLTPPSPYKSIDTLKVARSKFKLNSNRLNELGKLLGVGTKTKNSGGFELWQGCMRGDKAAWAKMAEYNKQDVRLLEKIYLRLRPWVSNHPTITLITGRFCPRCKSTSLRKRGYLYTATQVRPRFSCNGCGGWLTGKPEKRTFGQELKCA